MVVLELVLNLCTRCPADICGPFFRYVIEVFKNFFLNREIQVQPSVSLIYLLYVQYIAA